MNTIEKAIELQKQAYPILTKAGEYGPDLPNRFPIGDFVRMTQAGITKIEDVNVDRGNLEILNENGAIYKSTRSQVRKIG